MKTGNIILIIISFMLLGCKVEQNHYIGGWPFNNNKDQINNPGFGSCPEANGCECDSNDSCPKNSTCTQLFRGKYCVPLEGSSVPRFKGIDQFGQEVDLYDLAMQGKPILLEICSSTAQACQDFSAWKSHKNNTVTTQKWWRNKFSRIRDLIDNQEILWVNIIHLDENKNPASAKTANLWHKNYQNDNIIILSDPEAKMKKWVRPTGLPCMVLIDENMVLRAHALRGIEDAIDAVYHMLDTK